MTANNKNEYPRLDTLTATDRENPHTLTVALETTLHQAQKHNIYVMFPSLFLGLAGMGAQSPTLISVAAALLALRSYTSRLASIPEIRNEFRKAAANITEPRPQAELAQIDKVMSEDRQSLNSWIKELDPRTHYIRTPVIGLMAAWGVASANPTMLPLAGFILGASLLDQQGDFIQKIRAQTTTARTNLRAWRTGLHFG